MRVGDTEGHEERRGEGTMGDWKKMEMKLERRELE